MPTLTIKLPRPHPGQRRVLDEARRFNVVDCGRRFGKTLLGEDRLIAAALDGQPVAWFAPTYKMMTEVWRDLRNALAPVTARVIAQEHRLELVTGGVIDMWSLDTPGTARGRKYKRVVIDESAMVRELEDAWQQVIRPTLTDLAGDAWFLSTPKGFNFFWTLYERGQDPRFPDYASWQMPTSANPYINPTELEAARGELPDAAFRQEYLADFTADETIIFRREWWQGQNRWNVTEEPTTHSCVGRYLSWDTASKDKETNAYTACTVGELTAGYRLRIREIWRGRMQFPQLPGTIEEMARRYNADGKLRGVIIEDRSTGTSAYQTLRQSAPDWLASLLIAFNPGPAGGKAERANQSAVWCRNGCVDLPHPSPAVPWLKDVEDELFGFPLVPFKDQVDSFSQLILYLEHYLSQGWRARGAVAA